MRDHRRRLHCVEYDDARTRVVRTFQPKTSDRAYAGPYTIRKSWILCPSASWRRLALSLLVSSRCERLGSSPSGAARCRAERSQDAVGALHKESVRERDLASCLEPGVFAPKGEARARRAARPYG